MGREPRPIGQADALELTVTRIMAVGRSCLFKEVGYSIVVVGIVGSRPLMIEQRAITRGVARAILPIPPPTQWLRGSSSLKKLN